MKRAKPLLQALVGPLILLGVWQGVWVFGGVSRRFLPPPGDAFETLTQLLVSGALGPDLLATVLRWAAGFAIAILIGAPVGLLLGAVTELERMSRFLVEFFRSLPVTAVFPVFLVVFGVGDQAMVAIIAFATLFILMVHATYGVRSTPEARMIMARSFGATPAQIFFRIRIVEAAGHVLIGMRTVLSLSLIVAIVAEMFIGASRGLGQRLYLSYQSHSLAEMFALILVAGMLGYGANALFGLVERRVAV